MSEETTFRPDQASQGVQSLQREEMIMGHGHESAAAMRMAQQQAVGVPCPNCGAVNEPEAFFCASCGQPLRNIFCPNCGSEIAPESDFCEICHHYIKTDVCSFCGAHFPLSAGYCPECGGPRGGLVCPVCHTLNDFAFCKQCDTPLTDEAKQLVKELQMQPDYQELVAVAKEYAELGMALPYSSEKDVVRDERNEQLRERVLMLLAKDRGVEHPDIKWKESKRMPQGELEQLKKEKIARLSALLDKMEIQPASSPAKVRNYAMACKPAGVRLAWVCNFKHAMHSSPCGCAKPQLGGKWVVLDRNSKQEIKDDK